MVQVADVGVLAGPPRCSMQSRGGLSCVMPPGRRCPSLPDQKGRKEYAVAQGIVKWFNDTKGFGFISQPGGEDIFVHHTAIMADGFRTLPEGARVEFDVVQGPKGLQAANVRKL